MNIVPVLDLLGGVVVRGVAGRRDEYRPVKSRLTDSVRPLDVARAFRDALCLSTLYLADLDAILRNQPAWETYRDLADDGFDLWIDAGLRDLATAERLRQAGATCVVAGLETWPDPESLAEMCARLGPAAVIFSLDLKSGEPLGDRSAWGHHDAFEIAKQAVAAGVERMIVLDLAGVGVGAGVKTLELCRRLHAAWPTLHLVTGGGVRGADDLALLRREALDGVLLASALHDGQLARWEWETEKNASPAENRRVSSITKG
ncbi:MAG: HisA/HisF-related TIM barrel protein [Planctomycetaceae bacterium]